jgi:hypothetical protein
MLSSGWLAGQRTLLLQTSKRHEKSLKDLCFSFKPVVIMFELPRSR